MKTILTLFFLIALLSSSYSQEYKIVKGTSKVQMGIDETLSQARHRAKEQALMLAAEGAFGTKVNQESNIGIVNGKSYFNIIGSTKVGADIKEILDEDYSTIFGESDDEIWISCTVKIKASPATPKADIETYSLNLPDAQAKSHIFISGSELYLYFKTPADGFLSIYLDDNKQITKLFPDFNDINHPSTFPVVADKEYILFTDEVISDNIKGHELILETPLENEGNTIHVFFSENDYYKPIVDSQPKQLKNGSYTLETITRKNFEKWLKKNKGTLEDFIDYTIPIEIIAE